MKGKYCVFEKKKWTVDPPRVALRKNKMTRSATAAEKIRSGLEKKVVIVQTCTSTWSVSKERRKRNYKVR